MPKNKNAEYRFQMLDRYFSDFRHKYTIEDLLEKVNDKLYDANGSKSMIMERQLVTTSSTFTSAAICFKNRSYREAKRAYEIAAC